MRKLPSRNLFERRTVYALSSVFCRNLFTDRGTFVYKLRRRNHINSAGCEWVYVMFGRFHEFRRELELLPVGNTCTNYSV